jgi:phosphoglycerate dehydrogenase-like enzyme
MVAAPPSPKIAVAPTGVLSWLDDAVRKGGGDVVPVADATGLVWAAFDRPHQLAEVLAEHPHVDWVQLPWAGVENFRTMIDHDRLWTCAKGVYADPVAEHALGLLLAGLRGLAAYARRTTFDRRDGNDLGHNLFDARVVVLGGGGITQALLGLLAPFRADVTVVRRTPQPMPGAARVVGIDALHLVLPDADAVVLALAATPDTAGIIGRDELALLGPHTWLVNVARGRHVDTDALVETLRSGGIGGAALDVVDPEPLPDGHPLWSLPNCLITPHVGNTEAMARPLLAARVTENVRRYRRGEPLVGPVDPDLGY